MTQSTSCSARTSTFHSIMPLLQCVRVGLVLCSCLLFLSDRATAACKWKIVPPPTMSQSTTLFAVAAVGSQDVWATGGSAINNGVPFADRWDGSSWTTYALPNPTGMTAFVSIAAISATNVWAVGLTGPPSSWRAVTAHWNGSTWTPVAVPPNGGLSTVLGGIGAVSPTTLWAVGEGGSQTYALYWGGKRWRHVTTPSIAGASNWLQAVSATAGDDVWAVGFASQNGSVFGTLVEHWNGKTWQIVPSPSVPGASSYLASVVAVSPRNVWAVGSAATSSLVGSALIEHWDGKKWSIVNGPKVGASAFYGVAANGRADVRAAGETYDGHFHPLTEQWSGAKWVVVPTPKIPTADAAFGAIASVPGTTDFWAVGSSRNGSSFTLPLAERYSCGQGLPARRADLE
jgi:hypothetical protein